MKKWVKGFAIGFLALGLAACSDTADVQPGTDEEKKSDLTIGEVFEKAQAASEKVESMHADMDIKQNISAPDLGSDMDSIIKVNMDLVQEPMEMHQVMEMNMGDEGTASIELYITEEGFFMQDPESETWMKLPEELYEGLMASAGGADPTVDLASLEEFVEDFTFEQNDNEYILKLKASGEKFEGLVQDQLSEIEGIGEAEAKVLEDMKIHQLDYEIYIDKETFDTTAFNMIMDMEMEDGGNSVRITQDTKAKISNINELKEIVVPQEILDSAVEQ